MSRRTAAIEVGAILLVNALLWGCAKPQPTTPFKPTTKNYGRQLAPGQLALVKIDPKDYPDFGRGFADREGLEQAVRYSLEYMAKPSSQRKGYPYGSISHDCVVASLNRFLEILRTAPSPEALNQAIRNEYDVYQSLGCDDQRTVLFTGYYTPIFNGSRERTAEYKYPLYGLPTDLAKDDDGNCIGRKLPDGGVAPGYPTRQEIEQNRLLDGLEVAWVKDPFESYVITVQGSAKLRTRDGGLYELGYAGNNGHNYVPVRDALVRDGRLKAEEISLQRLLAYFKAHPNEVWTYCWKNPRYVFFKEAPGGPFGCLGQPVTPLRTIATDKQIFPRAGIAFYTVDSFPRKAAGQIMKAPYASFACDQDAGGAIRAAGRSDVFMGIGPQAEDVAGRTYSEGKLYYIFLKGR